MKRKIIKIDTETCTGCGQCMPNCPEGAIQMIDGKARLVSDLFCDGLGACLGHCPVSAIAVEEREAEPYDERRVMANIVKQGANTIRAHLEHLKGHGQTDFYSQAVEFLKEQGMPNPLEGGEAGHTRPDHAAHSGCPGSRPMAFVPAAGASTPGEAGGSPRPSQLTHWPVQLHLVSPLAPQYAGRDVLLAADCVAYALGDFHKDYLKGKALAIACPKLDSEQEIYAEKIKSLIDDARINTLTVMIMQVPCCGGLLELAKEAAARAKRKVPIKCVVVGLQGAVVREDWM